MDKRNESWNFLIYFEKQSATEQMASLDSTKYLEKEIANLYNSFWKQKRGEHFPIIWGKVLTWYQSQTKTLQEKKFID